MVRINDYPKVLFVEGDDDRHLIRELCRKLNLNLGFGFEVRRGWQSVLDTLEVECTNSERMAIGAIIDANDDIEARWNATFRAIEQRAGESEASHSSQGLLIRDDNGPTIGVWIMPDNQSQGALEDFIASMVRDSDTIWGEAEQYIERSEQLINWSFTARQRQKAHTRAWLAIQHNPGHVSSALEHDNLLTDGEPARSFIDWLVDLFSE